MKLFNYYSDNIDYTWYQSSNIKYSECIDNDNELKTLKIVFNNGKQYEYEKINVFDYLKFRDADSQGKAFNQFIKKYEFNKLEDYDLNKLDEEYVFRTGRGIQIEVKDETINLYDTKNKQIVSIDLKENKEPKDLISTVLKSVGYNVKDYECNNS